MVRRKGPVEDEISIYSKTTLAPHKRKKRLALIQET